MADMYSKIEQLCKENNTNITAMCRLLDISRSTLSELKAGRTKTLRLYQLKSCHLMTLPMQCTTKEKN